MYSCQRIFFKKNTSVNDFYKHSKTKKNDLSLLENRYEKISENKNNDLLLVDNLNKSFESSNIDIQLENITNPFEKLELDKTNKYNNDPLLKLLEKNLELKTNLLEYSEPKLKENESSNIDNNQLLDLSIENNVVMANDFNYLDKIENEVYYFCKLYDKIDYYILRILTNDIYDDKNGFSLSLIDNDNIDLSGVNKSKKIIIDIVRSLNHFHTSNFDINKEKFYFNFGDKIRFRTFSEYIFNLKKIFKSIRDSYSSYNTIKKNEFNNLIISLVDKVMELSLVNEIKDKKYYNNFKNNIFIFSDLNNRLNNIKSEQSNELDLILVVGNGNIKSIKMTKSCISNLEYKKFVDKGGYFKDKYWSKEGRMWKAYYNMKCPIHWKNNDGIWYINNEKLDNFYSLPIEQISYYEAEACARFYSGRLPTEEEWNFVASNRNLTLNPYGLYNPCKIDLVSDCDNLMEVQFGKSSLLGFNQLYGNVWEYTSTHRENLELNEICLKGGDSYIPEFLMNNSLKLFLSKYTTGLQTGFRIIKI